MTAETTAEGADDPVKGLVGTSLTVQEFLNRFGARTRTYTTVAEITRRLEDAGLTTVPSFMSSRLSVRILVIAANAASGTVAKEGEGAPEDNEGLAAGLLPQHVFRIGDLASARGGLDAVSPGSLLAHATMMMLTKGYSQLPVLDGPTSLMGVVTWASVATLYATGAEPTLANAMVTVGPPVAEVNDDLFTVLPQVMRHGYVLVRDEYGALAGIVTGADITTRFDAMARPFFMVGEIERMLRRCLGKALDADTINKVLPPKLRNGDIGNCTFGNYLTLLSSAENWRRLGWSGIDQTYFRHLLDEVRCVRNIIAHFHVAPVTPEQNRTLYEFVGLLTELT